MPFSPEKAEVVPLARSERVLGARVARIASFERGVVRVRCAPGGGAIVARVSAALDDGTLAAAARDGQDALVVFEDGDSARPVVVALLRPETPVVGALIAVPSSRAEAVARVDGKRVVIEGNEEVVLHCGRASLTLRKDGSVILRGVNVVSQAQQVQKIRGGKVQIN